MINENMERLNQMAKKRGHPFKILIVDDEEWVGEVFGEFCNVTDAFEVEHAKSGLEAVEKVRANEYDLVTVDLIMPEVSGLEVLSAIKKISPKMPIMVITGNATDRLVNESGLLGASRVLYKPVIFEDFIEELSSTLK